MPPLGTNAAWGSDTWSPILIEALGLESAVALGGVRFIPISGRNVYLPRVVTDPAADWYDELEEITPDAGDADTILLTPRKLASLTTISTEAIEDAPIDELSAVGRSMVRGVSKKLDEKFFSSDPATSKTPAGILAGTLPGSGTGGTVDIETITTGVGAVEAAGGHANAVWINSDDITDIRLAVLAGGYQISDPTKPGVEVIAGATLVPTPALTAGTAIVADTNYVVAAVRRDARVDFSGDAAFTKDGVLARTTMRVDWEVADANALWVVHA